MSISSRREFLRQSVSLGAAVVLSSRLNESIALTDDSNRLKMKLGLVTYEWGHDWDLPTIIANCETSKVLGVELRTEHKHGVEPSLGQRQRQEVKKRFADSAVTLVGLGTNQCFDSPDPVQVRRSIEGAKAFLQLSHDCGSSGVKVKPNDFQKNVPHEKTIEQIGRSLNILGQCAADLGQQVRLEVHGSCRGLPTIKQIMDIADHPSVAVCWNSNGDEDVAGKGLTYNFGLVKGRLGRTLHIHELNSKAYPFPQLFELLVDINYTGWALLESGIKPDNVVAAMAQQRDLFEQFVTKASETREHHNR